MLLSCRTLITMLPCCGSDLLGARWALSGIPFAPVLLRVSPVRDPRRSSLPTSLRLEPLPLRQCVPLRTALTAARVAAAGQGLSQCSSTSL